MTNKEILMEIASAKRQLNDNIYMISHSNDVDRNNANDTEDGVLDLAQTLSDMAQAIDDLAEIIISEER